MKLLHKGQHLGLGEAKCFCALIYRDRQEDKDSEMILQFTVCNDLVNVIININFGPGI